MTFHPSVLEAIGNTPLIKLNGASVATGCTILGKAEFLNPGQSVKDRAAHGAGVKKRITGFRSGFLAVGQFLPGGASR